MASSENKTSRALGLPGLFSGHEGPGLLSQTLLWFLAPRRDGTQPLAPGASSQLFIDEPNFFDYPDSDQASLLAVAQFIGEKPVTFVNTGMNQLDRGASLLAGPGRRLLLTLSGRFQPWALPTPPGGHIGGGFLPPAFPDLHACVSHVSMSLPYPFRGPKSPMCLSSFDHLLLRSFQKGA